MNTLETYKQVGNIAVITLINPPVNSLSHEVRTSIITGLTDALKEQTIEAIVLTGAGTIFCAGADIREFNTPAASAEPSLKNLLSQIESSSKPVIAAINGVAFGGGLELALSANYRVIASSAKVALPEVKLGLIPGAGGTQRLPRLIGAKAALPIILSGDPVPADKAFELGIADKFITVDQNSEAFLTHAIEYARHVVATQTTHPVISQTSTDLPDADLFFTQARDDTAKKKRGFAAPIAIIDAVEAAVKLPFNEGLVLERTRFNAQVEGNQSKAMRHLFFAERESGKIEGLDPAIKPRAVNKVGIIGAGTMGVGITLCFLDAGIPVLLMDAQQTGLDRGLQAIQSEYERSVNRGRISESTMQARLKLLNGCLNYEGFDEVDLAIEAVFEEMSVKKEVFTQLDKICKIGAILASNTSRLDINEIADITSRPSDVIGLHFFSPANVMRLLEVVRGQKTADDVVVTAMKLSKTLKKQGVLVGVCEGFVGNRMLTPYVREAYFLLEEGASVPQIDQALYNFGMAMGPLAVIDQIGLDVAWETPAPSPLRYSDIPDKIRALGRFGQKTGAGLYRYEKGARQPIADPDIEALIINYAKENNIARHDVSNEEIISRCIYSLINEGAKIIEEKIVQRASDIDLVYVNGYGFPSYLGGPMFYADTIGLRKIYDQICIYHKQHGEFWAPAPLLEKLAKADKKFYDQ